MRNARGGQQEAATESGSKKNWKRSGTAQSHTTIPPQKMCNQEVSRFSRAKQR